MSDAKLKYQQIVDRLYNKTMNSSINWEIGFNNDLECILGEYTIKLKGFRDEEGEPFEVIEIFDSDGRVVDSFNDGVLADLAPKDVGISSYYNKMNALRSQAKRHALGADKALDQILENLDDDIPF